MVSKHTQQKDGMTVDGKTNNEITTTDVYTLKRELKVTFKVKTMS